jgi:hypothetical protein
MVIMADETNEFAAAVAAGVAEVFREGFAPLKAALDRAAAGAGGASRRGGRAPEPTPPQGRPAVVKEATSPTGDYRPGWLARAYLRGEL